MRDCVLILLLLPLALGTVVELLGTVNDRQCLFKFVFDNTNMVVNRQLSRIECDKGKYIDIKNFKIRSEEGLEFNLNMKGGRKVKLLKATLEQITTTTTPTTELPETSPCSIGYTRVCGGQAPTQDDSSLVCPNDEYSADYPTSRQCSCLSVRAVEVDLAAGVNPLGQNNQGCVDVDSEFIFPNVEDAMDRINMSKLSEEWKIDEIAGRMSIRKSSREELTTTLMKAMQHQMKHKITCKSRKRVTKFIRSTKQSEMIGHNYMMMKSLHRELENFTRTKSGGDLFQETCQKLNTELLKMSECEVVDCNPKSLYRTISGCCNNGRDKDLGRANRAFRRLIANKYEDGVSLPRGGMNPSTLPSPRAVSAAVHRGNESTSNQSISMLVMQFGQFLDHDITLTPEQDVDCCNSQVELADLRRSEELRFCLNIDTKNDEFFYGKSSCHPFTRSDAICTDDGSREQFNAITSFIDASNIYGSDNETAHKLRSKIDGELLTHDVGPLLPTRARSNFESDPLHGEHPEDLVAGDVRAMEQPGLASMHSLFVNEHNHIAKIIKKNKPELQDERIYQLARKLVGAEIQNIVYSEFLPIVLGSDIMEKYKLDLLESTVYNASVDATIANEFATVAYRFGHSLIPNILELADNPTRTSFQACPLKDNFFNFEEFVIGSDLSGKAWQNLLLGLQRQKSPSMDSSISRSVLDYLFCNGNCRIPGGFGQDIAARNIQRGRDHGLGSYVDFRKFCDLSIPSNWTTRPEDVLESDWKNLEKVYTRVEDIDAFPGGLSEHPVPGGIVGPTFACIIGLQFSRLKEGDRFFFTNTNGGLGFTRGLPGRIRRAIRRRQLGDILCDNTQAESTAEFVMLLSNKVVECAGRKGRLKYEDMKDYVEIEDRVHGILFTGGENTKSVELFLPDTGKTCTLADLPEVRWGHTLTSQGASLKLLCGGGSSYSSRTSCLEFKQNSATGSWVRYATLKKERLHHAGKGTFLLGGLKSKNSTEIVKIGGGGSSLHYDLQQDIWKACAIDVWSIPGIILTGGVKSGKVVAVYDTSGFVEFMPKLNKGRYSHGCGLYETLSGWAYVVAGGISDGHHLSSTEVLFDGAEQWTLGKPLPKTLHEMASISHGALVYLLGGFDGGNYNNDILTYNGTGWSVVGKIKTSRQHAAATNIRINTEKLDISGCT